MVAHSAQVSRAQEFLRGSPAPAPTMDEVDDDALARLQTTPRPLKIRRGNTAPLSPHLLLLCCCAAVLLLLLLWLCC